MSIKIEESLGFNILDLERSLFDWKNLGKFGEIFIELAQERLNSEPLIDNCLRNNLIFRNLFLAFFQIVVNIHADSFLKNGRDFLEEVHIDYYLKESIKFLFKKQILLERRKDVYTRLKRLGLSSFSIGSL